ncbi:WD40/YVTN/BNR-like repeat-containing protein [Legionella erythra]|uniref:Ycf48-like protein n=1 Tax=Legionella erythra TaxID=448 RepID=A0A0W0TLY3_LEGER|nr:YCF48-related protein [Legionella erythra]KTC96599.1 Ycf48-like protein [Legionella erythra]
MPTVQRRKIALLTVVILLILINLSLRMMHYWANRKITNNLLSTPAADLVKTSKKDVAPWQLLSKGVMETVQAVVGSHVIYAGGFDALNDDNGPVYKSLDGGKTWTAASQGFPENALVNAVAALDEKKVYAATWGAGLFKTDDGGNTWLSISQGLPGKDILALSVVDENVVYVSVSGSLTSRGGIFKTVDGGAHWQSVYKTWPNRVLSLDAVDANTVYAGISPGWATNGTLMKTTDGGAHWSTLYVGSRHLQITNLAAYDANTVYAATSEGMLKSTDGGQYWMAVNAGLPISFNATTYSLSGLYVENDRVVYVGARTDTARSGAVYYTVDGGIHWFSARKGLKTDSVNSIQVLKKGTAYIGTNQGVFKSQIR